MPIQGLCVISIQLLFRWNQIMMKEAKKTETFQYNYCFGGILIKKLVLLFVMNFNTTIVSVEYTISGRITELKDNFNTTIVSVE